MSSRPGFEIAIAASTAPAGLAAWFADPHDDEGRPPERIGRLSTEDARRVRRLIEATIGDVFGVSRTSISVRYGDQAAKLTRAASLITPSQTGASAFGDIDGDTANEFQVQLSGLVALTAQNFVL